MIPFFFFFKCMVEYFYSMIRDAHLHQQFQRCRGESPSPFGEWIWELILCPTVRTRRDYSPCIDIIFAFVWSQENVLNYYFRTFETEIVLIAFVVTSVFRAI